MFVLSATIWLVFRRENHFYHQQAYYNKKSTQIVRLRLSMCWKSFSRQTSMRIHWLFWWICRYRTMTSTPINSKCCHICHRFWCNLKEGVLRSPILGFRGVLAGWDLHQSKAHRGLPNTSQYNVLLYLPPFGRNYNVKLCPLPQFDPIWGLGWTYGVQKWYQSKYLRQIHIQLLYTLYAYQAPFGHNTQHGRQSDRNRRPMI